MLSFILSCIFLALFLFVFFVVGVPQEALYMFTSYHHWQPLPCLSLPSSFPLCISSEDMKGEAPLPYSKPKHSRGSCHLPNQQFPHTFRGLCQTPTPPLSVWSNSLQFPSVESSVWTWTESHGYEPFSEDLGGQTFFWIAKTLLKNYL